MSMADSKKTNPRVLKFEALKQARKEARDARLKEKNAKKEAAKKPAGEGMKPVTREMTIFLHRFLHKESFKKRAPKAIKAIRFIAKNAMKTSDVRLDMGLNQFIWNQGIRSVAHRVRVRMARMPVEGEENKFYTLVSYVPVSSFKGLTTKVVENEEN